MKVKNLGKRGLALFLALVMCFSLLNLTVFAADAQSTEENSGDVTNQEIESTSQAAEDSKDENSTVDEDEKSEETGDVESEDTEVVEEPTETTGESEAVTPTLPEGNGIAFEVPEMFKTEDEPVAAIADGAAATIGFTLENASVSWVYKNGADESSATQQGSGSFSSNYTWTKSPFLGGQKWAQVIFIATANEGYLLVEATTANTNGNPTLVTSPDGRSVTYPYTRVKDTSVDSTNVVRAVKPSLTVGITAPEQKIESEGAITLTVTITPDGSLPGEKIVKSATVTIDGVSYPVENPTEKDGVWTGTVDYIAKPADDGRKLNATVNATVTYQNQIELQGSGQTATSTVDIPGSANTTFEVGKRDMELTKTVTSKAARSDGYYVPGETVTYSITVTNNNKSATLTGIVVEDPKTGDRFTLDSLAPGESQTFETTPYTVKATDKGVLTNTATATATLLDGTKSDSASVNVNVYEADLSITKTVDKTAADVGEELTYTITVTNSGDAEATNVTVTDTLPAGLTDVSASNGGTVNDNTITWSGLTVGAGTSTTLTVTAKVDKGASGTLTNSVTLKDDKGDPQGQSTADVTVNTYYTVTYMYGCTDAKGETGQRDRYLSGTEVTVIAAPEWAGHTFSGWVEIPFKLPVEYKQPGDTLVVDRNVTLLAKWDVDVYTVTFVYNNGTENSVASYEPGTTINMPASPTREGYVFMGWTTDDLGDMNELSSTDTFIMPNNDVTLTAQWEKAYSLTINKVDSADNTPLSGVQFKLAGTDRSFSQTTGEDGGITFDKLIAGTYTLTEVKAPDGYKKVAPWTIEVGETISVTGDNAAVDGSTVTIENEKLESATLDISGELQIAVKVGDVIPADTAFSYTLTGECYEGYDAPTAEPVSFESIESATRSYDIDFGTITFTKAGTYTYTVKETMPDDGNWTSEGSAERTITITVAPDADGQKLVATVKTYNFHFFHLYTQPRGDLTITKNIAGIAKDTNVTDVTNTAALAAYNTTYTFTVEAEDPTLNGEFSGVQFTDGKATTSVYGDGSTTIRGLPVGNYTVTETGDYDNIAGYNWLKPKAGVWTVGKGAETEAVVMNVYDTVGVGSLTLMNNVTGVHEEVLAGVTAMYTVEISGKMDDGSAYTNTITLGANGTQRLAIPAGEYTVTVKNAPDIDGYAYVGCNVTDSVVAKYAAVEPSATITITKDGSGEVTITHTYGQYRYALAYDAGEGAFEGEAPSGSYAGAEDTHVFDVTDEEPTREDYLFMGWDGVDEVDSKKVTVAGTLNETVEKTLTAQWAEDFNGNKIPDDQESFTLTYDANGGENAPVDETKYGVNETATLSENEPTSTQNVTFLGWSENDAYSVATPATEEVDGIITSVEFYDDDITVYAVWAEDENGNGIPDYRETKHTVGYQWTGAPASVSLPEDGNEYLPGIEVTVDGTYPAGTTVIVVRDTENGGRVADTYTFSGWSAEGVEISDGVFEMPDEDVALTGAWEITGTEVLEEDDAIYTVVHEYYTSINGGAYTLTGRTSSDYQGKVGQNITAAGFANPTYLGISYVYVRGNDVTLTADGNVITLRYERDDIINNNNDDDEGDDPADEPDTEIPDEDPPLADIPDEDPPLVDLPDEDVPQAGTPSKPGRPSTSDNVTIEDEDVPLADIPKTGDESAVWFYLTFLSAASLLCLLVVELKKLKKN